MDGILWYSSTAARALPPQNPYTKCMSNYSVWENAKGTLHSTATVTIVEGEVAAGIRLARLSAQRPTCAVYRYRNNVQ
jgi:hypothetical protein